MKTFAKRLCAVGLACFGLTQLAHSQGTTFTYQGRLSDGANPATGSYDLIFGLYGANAGGSPVTSPLTNSAVGITNGVFILPLDFGANFPGADRWLEISVRTNGGGGFTTLNPRQQLTPTPYAITASNLSGVLPAAQLSGTISSGQLGGTYSGPVAFNNSSNSFAGDGTGLTNVNATTLGGLSAAAFWNTTGNSGTSPTNGNFLGTVDNQPLELWVNNQRAFRVAPTTNGPNFIAGLNHLIGSNVLGMTIAGGVGNAIYASYANINGGAGNTIGWPTDPFSLQNVYCVIGGGSGNSINNTAVVNGGGKCSNSTIAGGSHNTIRPTDNAQLDGNTIGGGANNTIVKYPSYATIAGGQNNLITYQSSYGSIGGGSGNFMDTSTGATIAGGVNNHVNYEGLYSFIGGGSGNSIGYYAYDPAMYCAIVGGQSNEIDPGYVFSTIGGGNGNAIEGNGIGAVPGCTIAGGVGNEIDANSAYTVISGGTLNDILANSTNAVISGGLANTASGRYATIAGGQHNTAYRYAFAAGSYAQATNQGSFVWADFNASNLPFGSTNNNEFAARATGGVRFVTAVDGSGVPTAGVKLDSGGTSWATISDRNAKKNFAAVDRMAILEKLNQVPVEQWNYLWESDRAVPNLGPMAQDFKHAFYPGRDDKSITTLEFDGVELAAIQGLNQKLEAQLKDKDTEIKELKQRLEKLEQIVNAKWKAE